MNSPLSRRSADTTEGRGVPTSPDTEMGTSRAHAHARLVGQMRHRLTWTGLVICEWGFEWPFAEIVVEPVRSLLDFSVNPWHGAHRPLFFIERHQEAQYEFVDGGVYER